MLKTDDYKRIKKRPLDTSKFIRSMKAKSLLLKLFSNESVRVLFCPLSEWGSRKSRPKFSGTMLVSVDKTELYSFSREHGQVLNNLFEAGLVEVDTDTPSPDTKTVLFRLSDAVLKDRRGFYRDLVLVDIKRILMPQLQALAGAYGLAVDYQPLHHLFRITKRDGTRLLEDDYLLYHPTNGSPVKLQSDLTMVEWDDVFFDYYNRAKSQK